MTTQTVSNAVATKPQSPVELVRSYEKRFAAILPSHLAADSFMTLALGALRNAELAAAARNNPLALMVALTNCARLGHQPNTEAFYLVPFKGVITGIEGYRGVVERMYRAGGVSSIHSSVVRANDVYDYEEGMDHPVFKMAARFGTEQVRGDRIGVFAYAKLRDGGYSQLIEASAEDVRRHQAMNPSSSGQNSPWVKWPDAMWRKVPTRELEKWVPSSAEYREQAALASAAASSMVGEIAEQHDVDPSAIEGEVVGEDWPATPAVPA